MTLITRLMIAVVATFSGILSGSALAQKQITYPADVWCASSRHNQPSGQTSFITRAIHASSEDDLKRIKEAAREVIEREGGNAVDPEQGGGFYCHSEANYSSERWATELREGYASNGSGLWEVKILPVSVRMPKTIVADSGQASERASMATRPSQPGRNGTLCVTYNQATGFFKNVCRYRVMVTFCFAGTTNDFNEVNCAKQSFGGAGPLAPGGSDGTLVRRGGVMHWKACEFPKSNPSKPVYTGAVIRQDCNGGRR